MIFKNGMEVVFPDFNAIIDMYEKTIYKHLSVVAFTVNQQTMRALMIDKSFINSIPATINGFIPMFGGIKIYEKKDQKENCKPFYDMKDLEIYLSKYSIKAN